MKKLIVFIVFMVISEVIYSQKMPCLENYLYVRESLIEVLGKEWNRRFCEANDKKFYIKIYFDSTGRLLDVEKLRVEIEMSDSQFVDFKRSLSKKRICVFNPEVDFTFQQYVKFNNGKLSYIIEYNARINSMLIHQYKLKE